MGPAYSAVGPHGRGFADLRDGGLSKKYLVDVRMPPCKIRIFCMNFTNGIGSMDKYIITYDFFVSERFFIAICITRH